MLSQFTQFVAVNNSGSTLTFASNGRLNLKVTGWIVDPSTGKITYTPLSDSDMGFTTGTIGTGGEQIGSEIDNTSTLYLGLLVQLEVTHDEGLAADGTFDLYLSQGDATGELNTDASGYAGAETNELFLVGSLRWESNASDDDVIRSNAFEV